MGEFIQITTTTGTRQDAEQIAAELVSRRLAGCVQVSGPIVSTFRWQGKTESQEEWVCTIKTASAKLAEVQKVIEEIHPYEVPEVIATAIVGGSEKYLAWLGGEVSYTASVVMRASACCCHSRISSGRKPLVAVM